MMCARNQAVLNVRLRNLFLAVLTLAAGTGLTLFRHWEPGGETFLYWFFARVFGETGTFIILGRSPLYVLYLNLFHWMGYPTSVTVEYVATTLITAISLMVLLRFTFVRCGRSCHGSW